jgi:hypothetical protein
VQRKVGITKTKNEHNEAHTLSVVDAEKLCLWMKLSEVVSANKGKIKGRSMRLNHLSQISGCKI